MTDSLTTNSLVQRLRDPRNGYNSTDALMHEAADEIERLRADNNNIRTLLMEVVCGPDDDEAKERLCKRIGSVFGLEPVNR